MCGLVLATWVSPLLFQFEGMPTSHLLSGFPRCAVLTIYQVFSLFQVFVLIAPHFFPETSFYKIFSWPVPF